MSFSLLEMNVLARGKLVKDYLGLFSQRLRLTSYLIRSTIRDMEKDYSFKLNPTEMKLVAKIAAGMAKVQGPVPAIVAIRKAIRAEAERTTK